MKKIISILLFFIILLSFSSTLITFALDSNEYTPDNILVDFHGTDVYVKVFVAEDGTILMPVDILTFFGGLTRITDGSDFVYSESGSIHNSYLERQIRISKNGSYGKTLIQIPGKGSLSGVSVNFKDSYIDADDLYLPLEEIVPFLDAKIEITKDGVLHIYPNHVSIFDAITYGPYNDLDSVIFNLDNIIGGVDVISAMSLIIESVVNKRLDRLDFIFNTGEIKDYKKLFEKILVENETYLSAFDKEETPSDKQFNIIHDALNDGNDFIEKVDGTLGKTSKALKYIVGSDNFKNYKEFSKDLEGFGDFAQVVDDLYKIVDYADVLHKMVDDHREMLFVVYGEGEVKSTPAGVAANEVGNYYCNDTANVVKSVSTSALRDYLFETATKPIMDKITPYTIALDAIKLVIPGLGDLSDDYDVFYLDTIVSDSSTAYNSYYNNMTFDEGSLNEIRLSLIMTVAASKYAYDLNSRELSDDADWSGALTERDRRRITLNRWLEKLYLAADSVECTTPKYYSRIKTELSKDVQYLQLCGTIVPDTPALSDSLEFTLNNDGESYTVTGIGTCTDTDILIPSEYNGQPVTNIGEEAFSGCHSLVSITIPDSITSIGDYAFCWCSLLTSVTIPNSVTSIGEGAFEDCESLTSIIIPDSVTSIGDCAFGCCTSLVSITVNTENQYYKSIDGNLYTKDGSLIQYAIGKQGTSFAIPNSATSIGDYAFLGTTLESVTIPDSVTNIGDYAFLGTTLENITIPDSVTSIGEGAFCNCTSLDSVIIGDSVASISESAFENCKSLTSVLIGNSVTSIGVSAFEGCRSLTRIVIPDSVTTVDVRAFWFCKSLTSITIGCSVTSIGDYAFYGCTALTEIYFNATAMNDLNSYNYTFSSGDNDGEKIKVTIGKNVTKIPANLFHSNYSNNYYNATFNITIVEFEKESVCESIGDRAFCGCTSLENVVIPNSVTSIGEAALCGCDSLTNISIPYSVTSIGENALYGCGNLEIINVDENNTNYSSFQGILYNKNKTEIVCVPQNIKGTISIPDSVMSIPDHAFSWSYSLTHVTFGENSMLTSIGISAFAHCYSLISIEIPDGVTSIGSSAFSECGSLTSVTFGKKSKLTNIGRYAFNECDSLENISIPDSVTNISERAFIYCSSLTSATIGDGLTDIPEQAFLGCKSLTSVTIGDSVTSIGNQAFDDCYSLTSVYIPSNVGYISNSAFLGCDSLTSINVSKYNERYESIDGNLYTKGGNTLVRYAIGKTDTSFVVPDSVYSIWYDAFSGSDSLTNITISKGVTIIYDSAFSGCSSLTNVTIPDSVTSIGYRAFSCWSLKNINFEGTIEQWNEIRKSQYWRNDSGIDKINCTDGTID